MTQTQQSSRLADLAWLLFWGGVSSLWCLTAAQQLGGTFDEPVYLQRGLEHWRDGSPTPLMHLGTMPLPVDTVTLPLYLYERWTGTPLDPLRDWEKVLPWARAATLVFWWLLLLYGWLCARLLAGPWAGRLAVALLACEPSLLAHASLATTDVCISACLLILVYHFRAGREASWPLRVLLPAFGFGLALLAKASALVFGSVCMLVLGLEHLVRKEVLPTLLPFSWRGLLGQTWARCRPLRRDLTWIVLGGLAVAFVYVGSDWQPQKSFVAWARQLPDGTSKTCVVWLTEHLRCFSNAGDGLMRQITHNVRGHGAYLLGYTDPRALWFYFPVLLTIKMTVPILALLLLLLVFQPRTLTNWACLTAAVLLLLSLTFRVQIGIRLVLPLVALGLVGLAAALAGAIRGTDAGWRRCLLTGAAAAGVAWMLVASVRVWPHGLCYVNELWGGTRGGYAYVSEANYDWGQGLKELARWQAKHHIDKLGICYYGTDPTLERLPLEVVPLHTLPLQQPDDTLAAVRGRLLAISTTALYGALDIPSLQQAALFLRRCKPVGRTTTFFIYDFTKADGTPDQKKIASRNKDQP
jgi:hypothetical protein